MEFIFSQKVNQIIDEIPNIVVSCSSKTFCFKSLSPWKLRWPLLGSKCCVSNINFFKFQIHLFFSLWKCGGLLPAQISNSISPLPLQIKVHHHHIPGVPLSVFSNNGVAPRPPFYCPLTCCCSGGFLSMYLSLYVIDIVFPCLL